MSKSQRETHEATAHKVETCPQCSFSAPAFQLKSHKCKKPLQKCTFCKAEILYEESVDHMKECGSRTQRCGVCGKYVQAWEFEKHEAACVLQPRVEEPRAPQRPNRFLKPEAEPKAKAHAEEAKAPRSQVAKPSDPVVAKPAKPTQAVAPKPGVAAGSTKPKPGSSAKPGAGKLGMGKPVEGRANPMGRPAPQRVPQPAIDDDEDMEEPKPAVRQAGHHSGPANPSRKQDADLDRAVAASMQGQDWA